MKFTFLGTGTSQGVPVIGCNCKVCSSSDSRDKRLRTSGLIETEHETFVFDTGPDFRQQMLRANVQKLDAVLFTHKHKDHVAGMDDIRAFNFKQMRPMDIYADKFTIEHLKREYYYIFEDTWYKAAPQLNIQEVDEEKFLVGKTEVQPMTIMHARLPIRAYRIGGFAYVTDANLIPESSKEKLQNLDVLVLNALRIQKHPSHFTLEEALEVVEELKPKRAYFTHISHYLGTHQEVSKKLPEYVTLAYDGLEISI